MNTACSHCGKHFHVSDRALGKRAKCKSCGQVFVVRPEAVDHVHLEDAAPPPAMGSTPQMRPVEQPEPDTHDDPLAALADAADSTHHDHADEQQQHARAHGSYLTRREHGEHGKTAPGATASLVWGIVGLAFAIVTPVTGLILSLVLTAILQSLVGLLLGFAIVAIIGGTLGVFAVVNGNSARKRIRRSRGVLVGRGTATAGMLMGWATLLLFSLYALFFLILLIRGGPIVQTKEVVAYAPPPPPATHVYATPL